MNYNEYFLQSLCWYPLHHMNYKTNQIMLLDLLNCYGLFQMLLNHLLKYIFPIGRTFTKRYIYQWKIIQDLEVQFLEKRKQIQYFLFHLLFTYKGH